MVHFLKTIWKNIDDITEIWYKIFEWLTFWSILLVITIFQIITYNQNTFSDLVIKATFILVFSISTVLLVAYISKKSYALAHRLFPHEKSRVMRTISFIVTIDVCFIVILITLMVAVNITLVSTLK